MTTAASLLLPATVGADPLGVLVAFGAGILSFLSPCVLPLVPGYVSMVSGLSATEAAAASRRRSRARETTSMGTASAAVVAAAVPPAVAAGSVATAAGGVAVAAPPAGVAAPPTGLAVPPAAGPGLGVLLRSIGLFVAGFTLVFVVLGAAASGLGHLLTSHKHELTMAAGAVVAVLGSVLVVGALPSSFWARAGSRPRAAALRILGERRFHVPAASMGTWAAPVMGMAFAFAWTPCIGPVLGAVTALAATRSTLVGGVVLLFAYSLGLGVPFLVTGLAFGRLTAFYARARRSLVVVHLVGGAVLVAFGILLLAGQLGWLSAQFASLLDHVGLHRLTSS